MTITIPDAISSMLRTVDRLQKTFPNRKFTLDGRLVGDLGEILVADAYDVNLFDVQEKRHDGRTSDGRHVQIKATMKRSLTVPIDHIPEYYLGIKIHQNGTFTEVFNGPGRMRRKLLGVGSLPKLSFTPLP